MAPYLWDLSWHDCMNNELGRNFSYEFEIFSSYGSALIIFGLNKMRKHMLMVMKCNLSCCL